MNADQLEAQRNIAKLESALHVANEKRKIRDEFAGKAMQAMLTGANDWDDSRIATLAFAMADAMIEARVK